MATRADNKSAMEEALQAAIAKMNNGGAAAPALNGQSVDPVSLLIAVLPKLMERGMDDGEVTERLESLQNDELRPLRDQLARQQQLLERLYSAQKAVLRKLTALETVQSAIGGAVTSLMEQMARIELVDDEQLEPPDYAGGNGHSRGRSDFADLGMSHALSSDGPRRRPRRG